MFSEALSESQETTRLLQEDMSTIGYGDDERVFREWLEEGGTHTQANEESVEVVRSLSDPEEPISPSTEGDPDTNTNNNGSPQDGSIAQLTRRLRCLFATLTWPVVPLGTIVSFALLWVLYASFIADARKACSHPLHWYALASLIIVGYAPHHAQARSYFFRYYRERDGPVRPTAVRMYDQLFHTMCIFYVYGGVTLLQTCREDTGHSMEDVYNKDEPPTPAPVDGQPPAENTCAATCPNLYQALSVYVTTLEMFTFSLILPLMFLPCVYVWIIRRASVEADAFSQLQDRLEEEQALLNNGGLTAQEIMDSLEKVKLVSRPVDSSSEPELILLPVSSSDGDTSDARDGSNLKECCICMSEFQVFPDGDIENGTSTSNAVSE